MTDDGAELVRRLDSLAWRDVTGQEVRLVADVLRVTDGLVCGTFREASPLVARELSRVWGGQHWAGAGAVTVNRGRIVTTVLDWQRLEAVQSARSLAKSLGEVRVGWTMGSVARGLLAWLDAPQRPSSVTEALLGVDTYGYRRTRPGHYADMVLADLEAAYWSALCRLPSPRVTWLPAGPIWHPLEREQQERWDELRSRVGENKALRNQMVGVMLGSRGAAPCWCRGEPLPMKKPLGPNRNAALAIVRAVYELTWLQAQESDACYANTDCVMTHAPARFAVWDRYGYSWKSVAEGAADVHQLDVYRVGSHQTAWYRQGSRLTLAPYEAPAPPVLTLTGWH